MKEISAEKRINSIIRAEQLRNDIATMLEFANDSGELGDIYYRKRTAMKILGVCHMAGLRLKE